MDSPTKAEQAVCQESPTTAHWWLIEPIGAEPLGRCKFCGAERTFRGTFDNAWNKAEQHTQALAYSGRYSGHQVG